MEGIDAIPFAKAGANGIVLDILPGVLKRGLDRARKLRLYNLDFLCASATALPFKTESFDLLTSFSVIDHLPSKTDAKKAIKEFSRVTNRNGHVVITIPNKLFLLGTLMMMFKMFLQPTSFFEQRFTPKELILWCNEFGLKIITYDSKNPAIIDEGIMENNMPKFVHKIPPSILTPLFSLGIKLLRLSEKFELYLLGARFGLAAVKKRITPIC